MKKLNIVLAGLILFLFPLMAFADEEKQMQQLKTELQKKFLNTPIDDIRSTPISGLFEITSGKNVYYVDKTLQYLVFGGLIDSKTGVNLTDARVQSLNQIDVKTLPIKDSITFGSGKKHLYVFSDPDCPYCKKLHPELTKLKDVTIHVFLYPIKELHPNAFYHGVAIWCSKDRKKALDDIFSDKQVADAICENPVSDTVALGKQLGITGTPTMYFEDGSIYVGYAEAAKLQARLDGRPAPNLSGSLGGEVKEVSK